MTDDVRTAAGVWCRGCGAIETWVLETSHAVDGVVRRRECRTCGAVLWTIEALLTTTPRKRTVRDAYPPITGGRE